MKLSNNHLASYFYSKLWNREKTCKPIDWNYIYGGSIGYINLWQSPRNKNRIIKYIYGDSI